MIARRCGWVPLVAAALLVGCISEESDSLGPGGNAAIVIEMTPQLTFSPAHAQVRVGETVRWVNTSTLPHTATGDPDEALLPTSVELPTGAQPWNSGDVAAGAAYERAFTVPGTYRYFCIPHESAPMVGTLEVLP